MDRGTDWDDVFSRIGREIENRIRDVVEQSMGVFEGFSGEYRRPRIDMKMTSSHILLVFEMPGCSKEKIDLQVDESSVTVSGEYMSPPPDFGSLFPFVFGKGFRRTVRLPRPIDTKKVEAKYEAGLLFVKAKIATPEGVKIQIE